MDRREDGTIHVPEQNGFATETHRRVAEIIADYDPYLELHWIPPGSRGVLDVKPWAVVHRPPGKAPYYVMYAEDADERLLAKLFAADNRDKNVLNEVEKINDARELLMLKQEMEAKQECHELAASIVRSPKYHYKHNGIDFGSMDKWRG